MRDLETHNLFCGTAGNDSDFHYFPAVLHIYCTVHFLVMLHVCIKGTNHSVNYTIPPILLLP